MLYRFIFYLQAKQFYFKFWKYLLLISYFWFGFVPLRKYRIDRNWWRSAFSGFLLKWISSIFVASIFELCRRMGSITSASCSGWQGQKIPSWLHPRTTKRKPWKSCSLKCRKRDTTAGKTVKIYSIILIDLSKKSCYINLNLW